MSESIIHKKLIAIIQRWIKKMSKEEMTVYCDSEDNILRDNKPPSIYSYIPDVYAVGLKSNRIIVGEAKISRTDLESEHSEMQLLAYLRHCKTKDHAFIVLAVPIELVNCAKSFVEFIKRRNNLQAIETHVINTLCFE